MSCVRTLAAGAGRAEGVGGAGHRQGAILIGVVALGRPTLRLDLAPALGRHVQERDRHGGVRVAREDAEPGRLERGQDLRRPLLSAPGLEAGREGGADDVCGLGHDQRAPQAKAACQLTQPPACLHSLKGQRFARSVSAR